MGVWGSRGSGAKCLLGMGPFGTLGTSRWTFCLASGLFCTWGFSDGVFFSRLQTIRFFPIFFPALGTTGLLHAPIVCGFAALLLRTNFCLARGLFGTWGFSTGVSPPRLQTIGFFSHFLPRSWCHRCVACSDSLRICFALGCCTGVPGIELSVARVGGGMWLPHNGRAYSSRSPPGYNSGPGVCVYVCGCVYV